MTDAHDDNQELYVMKFTMFYKRETEDKIYYIVARSLINAIDRFYKLQPTDKIRLIRLLAERDIGRFSMKDKPDRLRRVVRPAKQLKAAKWGFQGYHAGSLFPRR